MHIAPFPAAPQAVFAHAPTVLRRAACQAVNLAVWHRPVPLAALPYLRSLTQHRLRADAPDPAALMRALPPGPTAARRAFGHDVARLAALLHAATGQEAATLRLEVLDDDACRRFHVDAVGVRLLTTYLGPATEYLPEAALDRGALSTSTQHIQRLRPGDVGLFKGERAAPGRGAVHRSPPVSHLPGPRRVRILLAIDTATAAP